MSKRLDVLRKNYEESRSVAAELNEESAGLKDVLASKQAKVMESVRKDLREFAGYAAGLDKGWLRLHLEDCKLDFHRTFGRAPCLIVSFEPDGDVKLKCNPGGYSHMADIYNLKQDMWGWYSKECKAFVTENWGMIAEKIEEELAKALENAARDVVGTAVQKRDALQASIVAVKENIDWSARKDTILYNAISLLMDETLEQYDDTQEWLEMIQKELGVSVEELEEMGIKITSEGGLADIQKKPVDAVLKDAAFRAGEAIRDNDRMIELD